MASRSYSHLCVMFDEYTKISKKDIEQAISSEMSGDLKNAYLAIGNVCVWRHGDKV